MRNIIWLFFTIISSISLYQCIKQDVDPIKPEPEVLQLIANSNITLGGEVTSVKEVGLILTLRSNKVNSTRTAKWTVVKAPSWVNISPINGQVNVTSSAEIKVALNTSFKEKVTDVIEIESDIAGKINVLVSFVPVESFIDLLTPQIDFLNETDSMAVKIKNSGLVDLVWTANQIFDGTPFWVQYNPQIGSLKAGESVSIHVKIDPNLVKVGLNTCRMEISWNSNGNFRAHKVNFNYTKKAAPPNNFNNWTLNHNIIDAEYIAKTNKIIAISKSPNRVYFIDPENRTEQSIDLPIEPKCVSIKRDGSAAVVGCDAKVFWINLDPLKLNSYFTVSADCGDIIYGNNDVVHIFPIGQQGLYSLKLVSGGERVLQGVNLNSPVARLHPSKDYIYTLEYNNYKKFSLENGLLTFLYENYNSNFPTNGNFWYNQSGTHIITRNGIVFSLSDNQESDVKYAGRLSPQPPLNNGLYFYNYITHNINNKKIYALIQTFEINAWNNGQKPAGSFIAYDDEFYTKKTTYNLDSIVGPKGEKEDPNGVYIFVTKDGKKAYVLANNSLDGTLNSPNLVWALQGFNIE